MRNHALITNTPFPAHYHSSLLQLSHGRGVWLWDTNGKKYIDFGSGIAVNAFGYGNRSLAGTVHKQMKRLVHVSNLYTTPPAVHLGWQLIEIFSDVGRKPFTAVHFGSSGAEANEAAIKYARLHAYTKRGSGNHQVLAFHNAFHGRTMGTLSATHKQAYKEKFRPLLQDFEFVPYNDVSALEATLNNTFCAVLVEVVQGEGGLSTMSPAFAQALNTLCKKYDVLLIADEIQTGLGRLGAMAGSTLFQLKPDILTLAKPLAGGLPLSATLLPQAVNQELSLGDHGTTFGGGPVTTAAAGYILTQLRKPRFFHTVQIRARELTAGLTAIAAKYSQIKQVCGFGMLQGLQLQSRYASLLPHIIEQAQDMGLLLLRSGEDVLRIAPPLIITTKELTHGLGMLDAAMYNSMKTMEGKTG